MNAWIWRALGLGAVAAAALAAWLFLGQDRSDEKTSAEAPQPSAGGDIALQGTASDTTMAAAPAETPDTAPIAQAPPPPTFDIVRVEKDGSLVAAGRAQPGAEVMLLDGTDVVESTKAGLDGSWALVTTQPLPPGDRELSIAAILEDGTVVPSEQVVVVHVPEPTVAAAEPTPAPAPAPAEVAAAVEEAAQEVVTAEVPEASDSASASTTATSSDEVMVVLTDKTGEGGTEVLQGGGEEIPASAVIISAVDYDVDGKLIVSGQAAAGADLIIYLNDQPVGQGKADGDGRFILLPDRTAGAGDHRIRVDHVGADGKVIARAETPFTRTEVIARAAEGRFVVVERGNSLWRIARGEYGEGLRYSVIYEANKSQIKNPDLIYPGQIFLIPASN